MQEKGHYWKPNSALEAGAKVCYSFVVRMVLTRLSARSITLYMPAWRLFKSIEVRCSPAGKDPSWMN